MIKKFVKIFLIFLISIIIFLVLLNNFKKKDKNKVKKNEKIISKDISYNSNIIEKVNYISSDGKGNEYIVNALLGEINYSNSEIIYLTDVNALIKLNNNNNIIITSDYGKYNTINFDTIFSQNVIINYLDNKIKSEYADFSIKRNSMIASRSVVYENLENILKADVIEINIKSKDTKIFMYENSKKVNIKSKN
tara:strand:+ start:250 stop:828 length:579 start_codon:yes stop_codon:yes gene_type:complete